MTWEAKEAIKEIQSKIWSIVGKLEHLAEPSLKGVSFEALQMGKADQNSPLWRAVSEYADLRREILRRHRTGEGIWYASVEILRWDVTHHSGESVSSFHEKCNSKKEAEEAARRMLAENAKHFSANTPSKPAWSPSLSGMRTPRERTRTRQFRPGYWPIAF
jgi:hypothetical protein